MSDAHYVVATIRAWNVAQYHAMTPGLPGAWHLMTRADQLSLAELALIDPRYVFFPHWSERVPRDILERYECVGFHESDLPFGRGGSPVQNLIERGYANTMVTAFRMTDQLDAGPVYAKRRLSLEGRAQDIYQRSARIVAEMIAEIAGTEPTPAQQTGSATVFQRRTPAQSAISPETPTLAALHDHIRMLDAEEYPRAFIDYGNFRIEIAHSALDATGIDARVRITRRDH